MRVQTETETQRAGGGAPSRVQDSLDGHTCQPRTALAIIPLIFHGRACRFQTPEHPARVPAEAEETWSPSQSPVPCPLSYFTPFSDLVSYPARLTLAPDSPVLPSCILAPLGVSQGLTALSFLYKLKLTLTHNAPPDSQTKVHSGFSVRFRNKGSWPCGCQAARPHRSSG